LSTVTKPAASSELKKSTPGFASIDRTAEA